MPTTVSTMQVREGGTYLPVGLLEDMGEELGEDDRLSVARKTGLRSGAWIGVTPKGKYKLARGISGHALPSTFFTAMFGEDTPYRVRWTGETKAYVYDDEVATYYRLERVEN